MAKQKKTSAQQTSLLFSHYEQDFLVRTLGDLIRRPEIALGELVANAWDAGASEVKLTIPSAHDEELVVEDDGCGLTKEQFDRRWMTLAYDRRKYQGSEVEFPPGRTGHRTAFGRNGQGRHGLLCFGDSYHVTTTRDGKRSTFEVMTHSGESPFVSKIIDEGTAKGHGTRLSVRVNRNLPGADRMRELLSGKFLHDPEFVVRVNGTSIEMEDLPGFGGEVELEAKDPESDRIVRLTMSVVEGEAGRNKHQSGVAFWIGPRLVGEAGWKVMGQPIVNGRTRPGRRLTFVVKSDDLDSEIRPDWTGFRYSPLTEEVGRVVSEAVLQQLNKIFAERVRETTGDVIKDVSPAMESLGRGERAEVAEVVRSIAKANPLVAPAVLNAAAEGVIEAKKSASVQLLMMRIQTLPADDVEGLHRLLNEWSVRDALKVLDEIGRRIKVVEAIQKLMGDSAVDELHVLHPLVTQARWLFGPVYDSPQYSANLGLRNAMAKVFDVEAGAASFVNPKKRPDLLVRASSDSSLAAVASEDIDVETNIATCRRILLVELKKGGFRIGRDEMGQGEGYIEDLLNSGHLTGAPYIHAFVVGHQLEKKTTTVRKVGERPEQGRVEAQTFAQLVSTANARLFRLREQVEDRYPAGSDGVLNHLNEEPEEAAQLGIHFSAEKLTPAA
jgi:hypothetical protein